MGLPMKYAAYLPDLPGCIAAVLLERTQADRGTQGRKGATV